MPVSVKVGEFRNRLSAYLRKVRRGGEVIITDRDTPIGKVVPMVAGKGRGTLPLVPATRGSDGLSRLKFSPLNCDSDPVGFLLKERNKR